MTPSLLALLRARSMWSWSRGHRVFGSDWPVALLAGDYAKVWRETNVALDRLGIEGIDRAA